MSQRGVVYSIGALVVAGGVIWWPASATMKKRAVANHFERSEALTKDGLWKEAEVELKKAIEIDPDYVEARDALATILSETGQEDEAKRVYDAGITRLPKNQFLLQRAATTMYSANRFEETIAYAVAGEKLEPGSRDFAYVHALALEKLGRIDEAHNVYVKALEKNPSDSGLARSAGRTSPEGMVRHREQKEARQKQASKKIKPSSTGARGSFGSRGASKAILP